MIVIYLGTSGVQDPATRRKLRLPKQTTVTFNGTLAPVGNSEFNKYLKNRLHNPFLVRPRPALDSRGIDGTKRTQSVYNKRAKLGFQYWVKPEYRPPKPG